MKFDGQLQFFFKKNKGSQNQVCIDGKKCVGLHICSMLLILQIHGGHLLTLQHIPAHTYTEFWNMILKTAPLDINR